jgi:hypothetical protein
LRTGSALPFPESSGSRLWSNVAAEYGSSSLLKPKYLFSWKPVMTICYLNLIVKKHINQIRLYTEILLVLTAILISYYVM